MSPTTPASPTDTPTDTRHHSEGSLFHRLRTQSPAPQRTNSTPSPSSSPTSPPTSPCPTTPSSDRPRRVSEADDRPFIRPHQRTDSAQSTVAGVTNPRARSRSEKRNSGTVMQVGRHGNDWLFGGFSFTDAVKALLSGGHGEH